MSLLDSLKPKLGVTTNDTGIVDEIQDLIDAARADLASVGIAVDKIVDTDPLIKQAITFYTKAHFRYDNPEADRFQRSYDLQKTNLALNSDYTGYKITFAVTANGGPVRNARITIGNVAAQTNSLGTASFVVNRPRIDYDYTIIATGYAIVTGSVYVATDVAVGVVLVAA